MGCEMGVPPFQETPICRMSTWLVGWSSSYITPNGQKPFAFAWLQSAQLFRRQGRLHLDTQVPPRKRGWRFRHRMGWVSSRIHGVFRWRKDVVTANERMWNWEFQDLSSKFFLSTHNQKCFWWNLGWFFLLRNLHWKSFKIAFFF